ncbi:MAG: hypothetical protein EZS28_054523, partial [Streblomastix strix]
MSVGEPTASRISGQESYGESPTIVSVNSVPSQTQSMWQQSQTESDYLQNRLQRLTTKSLTTNAQRAHDRAAKHAHQHKNKHSHKHPHKTVYESTFIISDDNAEDAIQEQVQLLGEQQTLPPIAESITTKKRSPKSVSEFGAKPVDKEDILSSATSTFSMKKKRH